MAGKNGLEKVSAEKQPEYEWENCVVCGASEEQYFLETGLAMLLWHTEIGPMCESCYADHIEE